MASDLNLVRGIFTTVAEKAPSGFPRSDRMKKDIGDTLSKSSEDERKLNSYSCEFP